MRIISPFKDFYDSALAFGSDPDIIYHRFSKVAEINPFDFSLPYFDSPINATKLASPYILIFCGKLYPFVGRYKLIEESNDLLVGGKRNDLVFSSEQIKSLARNNEDLLGFDREGKVDAYWARMASISNTPADPRIHHIFEAPILLTHPAGWWFRTEHKHPILINPCLRNLKFQSVYDPFSCFQEIAMFLANELAPLDIAPLRTGDDKTIARAKGFDDQFFRTAAPGHKKLNRQSNRKRKSQTD